MSLEAKRLFGFLEFIGAAAPLSIAAVMTSLREARAYRGLTERAG